MITSSTYYIDNSNGISFEVWNEIVPTEEYIAHLDQMTTSADWPPYGRMHVIDLRSLTMPLEFSEASIKIAEDFIRSRALLFKDFKVAVLISQAMDAGGILKRLLGPFPMIVLIFTRIDLACLWLDIDAVHVESALNRLHAKMQND